MKDLRRLFSEPHQVIANGGCLVIGEVAQAHDGSLGLAHAYIDAIAGAGADAVKFQTHIAAAESTPSEQWRVKFSLQDKTRYDYWKRMEFTEEQWHGLKKHADERGLLFLSSPFSLEAADLLTRVGVAAWKVASGELGSVSLLDRMIATGLPFILSSGMSALDELDAAVARARTAKLPLAVLQCTTAYPCPPEKIGFNQLALLRERYGCVTGLSDHSGTIYPGLAGVPLGMGVLEVHVTMSRAMFGPDVKASVTCDEFKQMIDGVRFIEKALAHPVDKNAMAAEMKPLRQLFNKSIVVRHDLPAGTVLSAEHLALKKPGTGLPEEALPGVLGKKLKHALKADALLSDQDVA